MKTYFGFAVAAGMFPPRCTIRRSPLSLEEAREVVDRGVIPCLNPSHAATVRVMQAYGLHVEIPPAAPWVRLETGDSVVVMEISGLPRLSDRHEYTNEEVASATFSFSIFHVE